MGPVCENHTHVKPMTSEGAMIWWVVKDFMLVKLLDNPAAKSNNRKRCLLKAGLGFKHSGEFSDLGMFQD